MDLGGLSDPFGSAPGRQQLAGSRRAHPHPAPGPREPPAQGAAGAAHPRSLSQERPRRPCSSLISPTVRLRSASVRPNDVRFRGGFIH